MLGAMMVPRSRNPDEQLSNTLYVWPPYVLCRLSFSIIRFLTSYWLRFHSLFPSLSPRISLVNIIQTKDLRQKIPIVTVFLKIGLFRPKRSYGIGLSVTPLLQRVQNHMCKGNKWKQPELKLEA
jgi:hypothetical protein